MVKHIVLFKVKEFPTQEEKQAKLLEVKNALEALIDKIEVLKRIEAGINANPAEEYDLALYTEFEAFEDIAIYANHPEHVAVSKNFIAPIKVGRACVDYII